jgi:uncharacterized protein (TIGR03546 family)
MIKLIAKFILVLNGNVRKSAIAAGCAWGFVLGLVPAGNLLWVVLFLVSLCLKHNHASKGIVLVVTKALLPFLLPYTDIAGYYILTLPQLQEVFITLYNTPFVLFTRYNNTLVAGGLAAGLVLCIPLYVLVIILVPVYRNKMLPAVQKSKIYKTIAKSSFINKVAAAATKISGLEGELNG